MRLLQSDKDVLETQLYDKEQLYETKQLYETQQLYYSLEIQKELVEGKNSEIILKIEN